MQRTLLAFITILLLGFSASAQTIVMNPSAEPELKGILFNNEWSAGARLYSNGWGVFGERTWIPSIRKSRFLRVEFQEIKDFRDKKQSAELAFFGPGLENPKDFFFGKQNQFYVLRIGMGQKRVLGEKAEKNGVRLSFVWEGGLSLGFLKPYYLDLAYPLPEGSNGNSQSFVILTQRYTEANKNVFTDWFSIAGASGWGNGFSEIEPVPGGYGKIGLSFDWASNDDFVKSLEAGFQLDVYYKRIPLSVLEDNKPFFMGAYIGFQFGKRWLNQKNL